MLLSYRFLTDVASVNSYEATTTLEINQGDQQDLYFQLIDRSIDRTEQGFNPAGRRYMPPAGSTMTVTMTNLDTGPSILSSSSFDVPAPRINPTTPRQVVRACVQPFAGDASMWKIPVLSSDPLFGTVNLKMTLTEGGTGRVLVVAQQPGFVLRVR